MRACNYAHEIIGFYSSDYTVHVHGDLRLLLDKLCSSPLRR